MTEKKSNYFNMGNAVNELKDSYGAGEKAKSVLKLFGKSLFNVGAFAVTEVIPGMVEQGAKAVTSNSKATDEQKEKAADALKTADEMRKKYGTGKYKED
jgi:hypothetical protein